MDEADIGSIGRALIKELTENVPQRAIQELKKNQAEHTEEAVKTNLFFASIQAGNNRAAHGFLLEGVSPNATDEHGRSGLHVSALGGHQDIFGALLSRDADPELGDEGGITPLMCACQKGSEVIVDILLRKGVDVTRKNKGGLSAVFYALYNGHVNVAEKVEQPKSCIHELQEESVSSIYMKAVTKNWIDVVKFMSERHCDISYHNKLLVASQAGLCGHTEMLQYFKVNYDDKTKDGRSPLHGAVQNGFLDAVKYMLDNGCNVKNNNEIIKIAILGGHFEILKLLRENEAPIFTADEDGVTPIQLAIVQGPFEMFKYLVEEGRCSLEAHKKMGSLALMAASKGKASVLKYMAEKNMIINEADPETGETPLLAACQSGPYETVELLLDSGCDPSARNRRGVTPALRAAHNKQEEILMLLGERGAKLDIPNRNGETAILCAARNKSFTMVRYLADNGCDLTTKDTNGRTVASYAVKTNNVALLRYLQQKKVFLDEPDASGMTPLMRAVKNEASSAIKQLTSTPNLCSINHRDLNGRTSMHIAVSTGKMEIVTLLREKEADLSASDHEGNTPLLESLKHKKTYEMLSYLIKNGCDIQATNNKLKSAVHYACKQKKNDALLLLLDAKAPFDSPDRNGMTPFTTSAKEDSESLTIILRAMGADVNNRNRDGENAAHLAAKNGSLKLTLCLSLFECILDQEDNNGVTPLIIACSRNKRDIVDFLLRKGAEANTVTHKGKTPAHFACKSGSLEVLKLLYKHGAELDKPDLNGVTPILLAAARQNEEFINFLCSQGCDLKRTDRTSKTALHFAVSGKNESVIGFLISKGLDPNALDESGTSPVLLCAKLNLTSILSLLSSKGGIVTEIFDNDSWNAAHYACKVGNLELLRSLRGQMSFSSRTADGENCLTIACMSGQEEVLKFLLEQKLNINFKNSEGENALHISARNSHMSLIPLLLESGIRAAEQNVAGNNALHILCQKMCTSKLDKVEKLKAATGEQLDDLKKHVDSGPDFMKAGFMKIIEKTRALPDILLKKAFPSSDYVSKKALTKQLKNLLDRKVDPNQTNREGKGALHFACSDGSKKVIELLLSHGADPNHPDCDGETAIFTAIRSGKEKAVSLLIKNGARLDVVNKNGQSPQALAIALCETQIIEMLRDKGAPYDLAATVQHVAVSKVLKNRNLDHLNFLIEIGFDGKKVENEKTLIHHAVLMGDVRILKALTDQRYEFIKDIIGLQDSDGDTALHLAITRGRLDVANVLIKTGCQFNARNKKGHTVLHVAAMKNQLALVKWVFANCPNICQPEAEEPEGTHSPLHIVASKGNLEVFKYFESMRFSAGNKSRDGMNCAHYAAISGNLHILQHMKDTNSESTELFREKNSSGFTPIRCAVLNGHEKIASFLYEYDPSLPDCIVHQALALGNQHMADWVEKRGTADDMAAVDPKTGETPLRAAVSSGNFHLVKRFSSAGSLDAANKHGNTPVQQAAARDYRHLLGYFKDKNAQLDIPNMDGDTPICDCATHGHLQSIKLLVQFGCNVKHKNAKQRSIVHLACIGSDKNGHLNIVKFAAEQQLPLDETDDQGNTGLMYSCRQGFKDIADFLLTSGQCDPNRANGQGSTAAHLAAMADRSDILDVLSQHGARLDAEDASGATPLMIAVHNSSLKCVTLLAEKVGLGDGSGRDRLGQLAACASPEVRLELEKREIRLPNVTEEQHRPTQIGMEIDMTLSTISPVRVRRQHDLPVDHSNNPFGYSMIQSEVTDNMRIEVASMADASSHHQESHADEEEDSQAQEAETEEDSDQENGGSDAGSGVAEEVPQACQQQ